MDDVAVLTILHDGPLAWLTRSWGARDDQGDRCFVRRVGCRRAGRMSPQHAQRRAHAGGDAVSLQVRVIPEINCVVNVLPPDGVTLTWICRGRPS